VLLALPCWRRVCPPRPAAALPLSLGAANRRCKWLWLFRGWKGGLLWQLQQCCSCIHRRRTEWRRTCCWPAFSERRRGSRAVAACVVPAVSGRWRDKARREGWGRQEVLDWGWRGAALWSQVGGRRSWCRRLCRRDCRHACRHADDARRVLFPPAQQKGSSVLLADGVWHPAAGQALCVSRQCCWRQTLGTAPAVNGRQCCELWQACVSLLHAPRPAPRPAGERAHLCTTPRLGFYEPVRSGRLAITR
jgi:hypothetical protein